MKKVTRDDLGMNLKSLPDEERKLFEKMQDTFIEVINKAIDGSADADEIEEKFKSYNDKLKSFDAEKFNELIKDNNDLRDQVKALGESIDKAKSRGFNVGDIVSRVDETIEQMFESEKFKSFVSGTTREARGFELKEVSMSGNYTGTTLISEQNPDVVSKATNKKLHVRNFASVLQGDPEFPIHAWQMIYDVDKNARYVSENGTLPESSFKVKEESANVKRVGTHIKMSKRMLKSRVYVRSYILNMVLEAVLDAEDFGILYGDGSGDNLKGITSYEGVMPVETIIGTAIFTGAAGSVTGIAKYGKGLMLTLAAPNDLLIEGLKIQLTSSVENSPLTGVYDVIKANDTQIYIEKPLTTAQITAESSAVASLTFAVKSGAYKSVESPNSVDALETAVATMTYAQFAPTFLGLNPITINSMRAEKDTTGNRLDVVKDMNGNPVIAGLRVVPLPSVPVGKYFIGDFRNGAEIIDYTGLTLDWADDVNTKLKNQVVLIAQEELIVPVKCPWAFTYGSLAALKTAIAAD